MNFNILFPSRLPPFQLDWVFVRIAPFSILDKYRTNVLTTVFITLITAVVENTVPLYCSSHTVVSSLSFPYIFNSPPLTPSALLHFVYKWQADVSGRAVQGVGLVTARLRWLRARIPPGPYMSFSCECCVFSGRGLCDGLITRPEECYWMLCVRVRSWSLDNEGIVA
jgi:hypothetical protein